MATVRDGNQAALLVVDVQVGVVAGAWQRDRVVANVATALERARATGTPVLWVQHADDELVSGSPEWGLVPELAPGEGEPVIHKNFNSSFQETDLEEHLARVGATHVVLAGALSNWCIRATAYGALDRGYDLTLLRDAHTTEHMDLGGGRKVPAENIVDELNACMSWVSYPGRTNGTANAVDVDFAQPGGDR